MNYIPKTGSFEGMKLLNQSIVLNVIRLREPISRAEIAKITKLTPPTVGSLVNELIDQNLITEEQSISSKAGGRRPIMLRINYSAHFIIGVYAAAEVISVILTTMNGSVIFEYRKEINKLPSTEQFMHMVKECIQHVLDETSAQRDLIIGIGFAMHGLVDPEQGLAIFSPHLHLENIPIKEILEKEFSLPVMVENDVRALAYAESWFGEGKGVSDFVCLSVGRGIGSGIFINNDIYKSSYNTAGEIGHTIVDINGPRCQCGNNGCLEAYASELAIIKKAEKESDPESDTILREWKKDSEITVKMIFKAAGDGDQLALSILEESGRSLGLATANLINILKPSKIILEGSVFEEGNFILSPLKDMIGKYSFSRSNEEIPVVCSKLGKKGMVLGAVTIILRKLFAAE
ncbi:transcriptional regulator, MarR family [Bacillus sp. OV322]|uniref:ROK family transcriptional regulator n=1 Tax=Bacillus sp. OV322 TaxID=1882764 RepID=UPI0008EDD4D4|nr:ROK family transcriptional regulator [Bacillus sp. OV322]SFC81157.1 transcriptional regulator, MarR family [Bacillus sp. OV322]